MTTLRRAVPVLVLPLLLLTACGGGEASPGQSASASASSTSSASPSSSSSSSTTPPTTTAPPTEEEPAGGLPPFVTDGEPAQGEAGSAELGVTDLRVARQDGFDRVVVELAGEGTPGWFVQYVDAPTRQGSGDPLEMEGEAFLVLIARGVASPEDGAPTYAGPADLVPSDTAVVREVVAGTTYEGDWDASVGLSERRPYRVFALQDPPRVVLDVAHEG